MWFIAQLLKGQAYGMQVGKLLFSLNIDPAQLPSGPAASQDWDRLYAQGERLSPCQGQELTCALLEALELVDLVQFVPMHQLQSKSFPTQHSVA